MSVINKMLRDLDRRHALERASGVVSIQAGPDTPRLSTKPLPAGPLRAASVRQRVVGAALLALSLCALGAAAWWGWGDARNAARPGEAYPAAAGVASAANPANAAQGLQQPVAVSGASPTAIATPAVVGGAASAVTDVPVSTTTGVAAPHAAGLAAPARSVPPVAEVSVAPTVASIAAAKSLAPPLPSLPAAPPPAAKSFPAAAGQPQAKTAVVSGSTSASTSTLAAAPGASTAVGAAVATSPGAGALLQPATAGAATGSAGQAVASVPGPRGSAASTAATATSTADGEAQTAQRQQQAVRDTLAHAQSLWSGGSREGAIDLLQQAVSAAERSTQASASNRPALVQLVRELTRLLLADSRPLATWDVLARLEPLLGSEPDLLALRANAAQRLGRHQDSVQAYTAALQMRPGEQRWMLGAAVSLAALGQTAKATELADKARQLGPVAREVQSYLRQMGVVLREP